MVVSISQKEIGFCFSSKGVLLVASVDFLILAHMMGGSFNHIMICCDGGRGDFVEIAKNPILKDGIQEDRKGGDKQKDEVLILRPAKML